MLSNGIVSRTILLPTEARPTLGTIDFRTTAVREMPLDSPQRCRSFADWIASMAARHDNLSLRHDLPGFGEPQDGSWDGLQRINTETRSVGTIGVFRHGALERLRKGPVVARATGAVLGAEGFECRLDHRYDGRLFEVRASDRSLRRDYPSP